MIHSLSLAYLRADAAVTGICSNTHLNPSWVITQDSNVSEIIWSSGWEGGVGWGRGVPVYVAEYMLCVNTESLGRCIRGELLAGDAIIAGLREVIRQVRFDTSKVPLAKKGLYTCYFGCPYVSSIIEN